MQEYVQMCMGLEIMAEKYKSLQISDAMREGKRLQEYRDLFKQLRIGELIRRLLKHNHNIDSFLAKESWEQHYAPEDYKNDQKIAIYTALFGNYDTLPDPIIKPHNIDYYIFTDKEVPAESKWIKLDTRRYFSDNVKLSNIEKNRFFKMQPHLLFPEYNYSIYVDANVLVVSDLTPMIKTLDDFPLAMFHHKNRDCVYEEAAACIIKGKDDTERLQKHVKLLEEHGVPHHSGLLEATVIVRKHHDKLCKDIMTEWWDEFLVESKRDQLSLIDVLWMNGVQIDSVGVLGNNLLRCNKFIILPHN